MLMKPSHEFTVKLEDQLYDLAPFFIILVPFSWFGAFFHNFGAIFMIWRPFYNFGALFHNFGTLFIILVLFVTKKSSSIGWIVLKKMNSPQNSFYNIDKKYLQHFVTSRYTLNYRHFDISTFWHFNILSLRQVGFRQVGFRHYVVRHYVVRHFSIHNLSIDIVMYVVPSKQCIGMYIPIALFTFHVFAMAFNTWVQNCMHLRVWNFSLV
jgi:hypothetical protein